MSTSSSTAATAPGAETKECKTKSDSLDSRFDKWQCPKCDITVIWFKNVPDSIDTTVQFISAHVLSDCAPEQKADPTDKTISEASVDIHRLVKKHGEAVFHIALYDCATKCLGKCLKHFIVHTNTRTQFAPCEYYHQG